MIDDHPQPAENALAHFFDHSSFFMLLLLLLVLSAALYVIVAPRSMDSLELQEGQISPYTLYADFNFQTVDEGKTSELAEKIAAEEPDFYKIDDARRFGRKIQFFAGRTDLERGVPVFVKPGTVDHAVFTGLQFKFGQIVFFGFALFIGKIIAMKLYRLGTAVIKLDKIVIIAVDGGVLFI